jgi:cellulose synthase/poly-beta-1,6-N-acetylglucosamine synthase-like glycosyltransferase
MIDTVIVLTIVVTVYGYLMAAVAVFAVHRAPRCASRQAAAADLLFVLLVPALNEEQVIGKTLTSLLRLVGMFIVMVIDDASDDGTLAAIQPFLKDPRVLLLERPRAVARTGKGASLNAAFAEIQRLDVVRDYPADRVIVVVFDSDGQVDPHFLQAVGPYFDDPTVAGVQSAVRMYNAHQNLLTFWQHFEFIVWGEALCRAKDWLGSATLGGNGQCVRFSALASLGPDPWQPSLVDDLDLALRLVLRGWRLRFCPSVAVWQEAVPDLRRLVRQRSRWLQGHLACWCYVVPLLRSRAPLRARLDLLALLLLPATFVPIGLSSVGSWGVFLLGLGLHFGSWSPVDLLVWYALGFATVPVALVAWGRVERPRPWRLLLHSHLFAFYSFIWFLAGLGACWNVLLARRSWAKTSRVGLQSAPVASTTAGMA